MMKNEFMVSVIVLTYNQEQWISQTLNSIMQQKTDYMFEVIVGEDFGTDKTREICKDFVSRDSRVRLSESTQNLGLVGNFVNCMKQCNGKYIMCCAGDDYWHNENKIQLQVEFMERNPECAILHTDFNDLDVVSGKTFQSVNKAKLINPPEGYIQQIVFHGNFYMRAVTGCYRHSLLKQYVPFDDFVRLNFPIEDWPMQVVVSHYGTVNYLPISTATYRRGHETLSNFFSIEKAEQRFENDRRMIKYLCDMFPNDLNFDENRIENHKNEVLLTTAYKVKRYDLVRKYGKLVKSNSFKKRCSQNWFMYKIYQIVKS